MIRYVYPNPKDRTWTKEQWKDYDRISRVLSKIVSEEMEKRKEELDKMMSNYLIYGTTHPEAI